MHRSRYLISSYLIIAALVTAGCADASRWGTERYSRDALQKALDQPAEDSGVVLGVFPLKKDAIIDGDTVKVGGLDGSLRLLGIDTEETFKKDADWRKYEVGWEQYLANEAAKTSRPVKIATPNGMDAKHWAKGFFHGLTRVRLERDHPKEVRGRYNRFLSYIFVERDGELVNYNVECVRAGMSPYFTKYGYSRRFHDEFVTAEREARDAQVGIWEPDTEHYPDYDVRIPWWLGRAAFIEAFEREAADREDFISLTHWDALRRMQDMVGEDVTVLATVGSIHPAKRGGPNRVMLSRRMFGDFPLVVFDEEVLDESQLEKYKGEYVRVRGMVSEYENKRGEKTLQITLRNAQQVTTPTYFIPGVQAAHGDLGPPMPSGSELPAGPFHGPGDAAAPADGAGDGEPTAVSPEPEPAAPEPVESPGGESATDTRETSRGATSMPPPDGAANTASVPPPPNP